MGIFEIVSAIVLIIACVFIVVVVLMKETKTQMSQTISGSSSDSFFQKNAGRTKEAMLNKATVAAAIVFFVLALAVNVINIYWGGNDATSDGTSISDDADDIEIPDIFGSNTDNSDNTDNSNYLDDFANGNPGDSEGGSGNSAE